MKRTSFFRQLVRVVGVNTDCFYVVIPGWHPDINVKIYLNKIPDNIRPLVVVGKRLHARINIGVEDLEELVFMDWETK